MRTPRMAPWKNSEVEVRPMQKFSLEISSVGPADALVPTSLKSIKSCRHAPSKVVATWCHSPSMRLINASLWGYTCRSSPQ